MTKLSPWTTTFASLQWLFFIFANTVVVPVSIGAAFELPPEVIAGMLRSSLMFTGLACVLQGLIGHRYPLMEGHSGVMWGFMLNLSASASSMGMSLMDIGGGIATGMLLAGGTVVLLGAFGLLTFLKKIFTPMVMSVYLFLLTFQLILIFFTGMFKVSADGTLDLWVSLFSLAVAVLVGFLVIKGGKGLGNFAILIGMVVGWVLYVLIFPSEQTSLVPSNTLIPLFPLGMPNWNIGIIAVTFLATVMNLSNTIASVEAAAQLFKQKAEQRRYHRSYILSGCYSIGAGLLGLVSYAPFASTIGFLESTRVHALRPFLIGGSCMIVLGIVPFLGGVLATLPITVGNAVLFIAYLQLFGTSMKSLNGYEFQSKTIYRLAVPVLVGVSIMNMDASLFANWPALLQPLVTDGFIMGVLLSIVLEKIIRWEEV